MSNFTKGFSGYFFNQKNFSKAILQGGIILGLLSAGYKMIGNRKASTLEISNAIGILMLSYTALGEDSSVIMNVGHLLLLFGSIGNRYLHEKFLNQTTTLPKALNSWVTTLSLLTSWMLLIDHGSDDYAPDFKGSQVNSFKPNLY